MSEWQSQKSQTSVELRAITQKYEVDLKTIQHKLEEEKERANELECTLKDKVSLLEEKEAKWDEMEAQYKVML